jgi:hypothetical protein
LGKRATKSQRTGAKGQNACKQCLFQCANEHGDSKQSLEFQIAEPAIQVTKQAVLAFVPLDTTRLQTSLKPKKFQRGRGPLGESACAI